VFGRVDPTGYNDNSVAVTAAAAAPQEVQAPPSKATTNVFAPRIDSTAVFSVELTMTMLPMLLLLLLHRLDMTITLLLLAAVLIMC